MKGRGKGQKGGETMRGEERGTREGTKSEPEVWRTYGQILVELIQH